MSLSYPDRSKGDTYLNLMFVLAAFVIAVLLIAFSVAFEGWRGPSAWLNEWTAWAGKYIALVVAAHSVVKLVDATAVRLRGS